jgi:hypothetical protein
MMCTLAHPLVVWHGVKNVQNERNFEFFKTISCKTCRARCNLDLVPCFMFVLRF